MKYKVGDRVKVRADLSNKVYTSTEYGLTIQTVVSPMLLLAGKHTVITEVDGYQYKIEGSGFRWVDSMFEEKVVVVWET